MTVRIRDLRRSGMVTLSVYNTAGVLQYSSPSATGKVLGDYQYIDSVDTGSFVPGVLRLNPVVIYKSTAFSVPGEVKQTKPYSPSYCNPDRIQGDIASKHVTPVATPEIPAWNSSLHGLSLAKARAKAKEPDLGLGQMIAELSETIAFLKNPLKKSLALWRKFAARKYNTLGDVGEIYFKTAADAWLAYRYGLMPLVLDCAAYMKYVEQTISKESTKVRRINKSVEGETITTSTTKTGLTSFSYPLVTVIKTKTKSTSHIYFKIDANSSIGMKMHSLGMHPYQWPSLVWEKTMFSFIADWFVNFGTWVQAISPSIGKTFLGSCTSQKTVIEKDYSIGFPTFCNGYKAPGVESYISSSHKEISNTLRRQIDSSSVPLPGINAEWLNLKRSLDSLALLSRMIVSLIRKR